MREGWSKILLHFPFVLCKVRKVGSETKNWTRNTNYDNPLNWDLARVPCSTDRVIFPSQIEAAVQFRDGSTVVKEMVLPSNGEIMLPLTCSLAIGGNSVLKDKCPGQGNKQFIYKKNVRLLMRSSILSCTISL